MDSFISLVVAALAVVSFGLFVVVRLLALSVFYLLVFIGCMAFLHREARAAEPPSHMVEADQSKIYQTREVGGTRMGTLSFVLSETPLLIRHPKLAGVDPDLQKIIDVASKVVDLVVFSGVRTMEEQKKLKSEGKTTLLNSRHLSGNAIDVVFKHKDGSVTWKKDQSIATTKFLKGIGVGLGIKCLRDGTSWDKGLDISNNRFMDGFHLEIKKWCER